jgi:hypothetical protein
VLLDLLAIEVREEAWAGVLELTIGSIEQLVLLGEEVFSAWQGGRPLFRRVECGEARFAVRRGPGEGGALL